MPSSVINHFSYNADAKSLRITFVTGLVYQYKDVPQKVFNMLKSAGSKGRYFNHYIKDKYKFQRIEE